MLLKNIYRLFNIHRGEGKSSLFFSLFAFFWAFGISCGSTLSEGLFLETLGAHHLPTSYIVSGLVMCLLSITLLRTINRYSSEIIFIFFFAFSSLSYLTFIFAFPEASLSSVFFVFVYKTFSDVLFMAFTLCFWNYIDQFYDMQDAKRVYCFFNSAILLGTACGGALISEGLDFLGMKGLFYIILLCLLTSALLFFQSSKRFKTLPSEEIHEDIQSSYVGSIKRFLKEIVKSPFSVAFALSFLVSQILLILTTYGYMDAFENFFSTSPYPEGALTAFLGTCTFWVAIANMIFGLFFYSRLIRFSGVNNIILITPLVLTGLYFSWSFSSIFILAIIGLFIVEGIWFSIDENTCNLLVNVVPAKIKRQVRVAIESFFEPIGMTLCGLALLIMQGFDVLHFSAYLGLALSLIFVFLTFYIRKKYKSAVIYNLSASAINFKKSTKEWLDELTPKDRQKAHFHFLCLLRNTDEEAQIFAFKALLNFNDPKLLPHLVNHLDRYSIRVRVLAIKAIERSPFITHKKVIERMLFYLKSHRHPEMMKIAYSYLARQKKLSIQDAYSVLSSGSPKLKSAGVLALMQSTNPPHAIKDLLNQMLISSNEYELSKGLEILGFMKDEKSLTLLMKHLDHPSKIVFRSAASAIANRASIKNSHLSKKLIPYLSKVNDIEARLFLIHSIQKFNDPFIIHDLICSRKYFLPKENRMIEEYISSLGGKAIPKLLKILMDSSKPHIYRVRAGRILSLINFPLLRKTIKSLLNTEIQNTYFYFYHAHTVQSTRIDLSWLSDILKSRFRSLLDFIIQILAISGKIDDAELLSRCVRSNNQKIHSNAIETIEKITESKLYQKLLPFINNKHPNQLKSLCIKMGVSPLSLDNLLNLFLSSKVETDHLIASKVKRDLELKKSQSDQFKQGKDPLLPNDHLTRKALI